MTLPDYPHLMSRLAYNKHFKLWQNTLEQDVNAALARLNHGDLNRWLVALDMISTLLNGIQPSSINIDSDTIRIGSPDDINDTQREELRRLLMLFHPWRKGPFEIYGIHINTEWRSDWKWNRIKDQLPTLENRIVLDVGCGSGYHAWRMASLGARHIIGIDPTLLYVMQYFLIRQLMGEAPPAVDVLPLRLEDIPPNMQCFDVIFSMGVLYHRKSPIEHLEQLRDSLAKNGSLILETLVIDGQKGEVLLPSGRYAKMRNVWFIPSNDELVHWCKRVGFKHVEIIDTNQTSTKEQRTTAWMTYHSLSDFLNPNDDQKTIEGYPAPLRSTLIAKV